MPKINPLFARMVVTTPASPFRDEHVVLKFAFVRKLVVLSATLLFFVTFNLVFPPVFR